MRSTKVLVREYEVLQFAILASFEFFCRCGVRLAHVKSMHQENEWNEVRLDMHALCQSLQRDGTKWTSIWLNLRPLQKILYNANLIKFSSEISEY